jgi:type IV pilus assembly protein PilP
MDSPMNRLILILLAGAFALAGCSSEQTELRAWMEETRRNTPITSETVTEPKKFEPYRYQSESQVDPFNLGKLSTALNKAAGRLNPLTPDMQRRREPLEAYPMDAIRMVGSIRQGQRNFALLQAENLVYQARIGMYAGQNFGLITGINETEVKLKELVQDAAGDWVERETTLQLQEVRK